MIRGRIHTEAADLLDRAVGITTNNVDRASSILKNTLRSGGGGAQTRDLRIRPPCQRLNDQPKQFDPMHQIACKTWNLAAGGTVPVRPRYGCKSPLDAGVTPG